MKPYTLEELKKNLIKAKKDADFLRSSDGYALSYFKSILNQKISDPAFFNAVLEEMPLTNKKSFDADMMKLLSSNNHLSQWFGEHYVKNLHDAKEIFHKLKNGNIALSVVTAAIPDISKEDFIQYFLDSKCKGLSEQDQRVRQQKIHQYYYEKYSLKDEIFDDIKEIEKKDSIINNLIKGHWFDTQVSNEKLKSYINQSEQKTLLLSQLLTHSSIEFYPVFQKEFKQLFTDNCVRQENFFAAVSNKEKRDYIREHFISSPDQLSNLINSSLASKMNLADKTAFNNLIDEFLVVHQENPLTVKQLCIMCRRCFDTGQSDTYKKIMNELKASPELLVELKNLLNCGSEVVIHSGLTTDLSKEPIVMFLRKEFHDDLNHSLETKANTRKMKI